MQRKQICVNVPVDMNVCQKNEPCNITDVFWSEFVGNTSTRLNLGLLCAAHATTAIIIIVTSLQPIQHIRGVYPRRRPTLRDRNIGAQVSEDRSRRERRRRRCRYLHTCFMYVPYNFQAHTHFCSTCFLCRLCSTVDTQTWPICAYK